MTQLPAPAPANTNAAQPQQQYNGPLPGVYEMNCIDADLGFTNGSETEPPKPQVALLMEFVDGPYKGTALTWYGFFTERTMAATIRTLRLLGWTSNEIADLSSVRGKAPCTIQIEPDLEGVPRARIRFIGSAGIAMKTTMSADQKQAFSAALKAKIAGDASLMYQGPPQGQTAPAQAPAGTPGAPPPQAPPGQKFF